MKSNKRAIVVVDKQLQRALAIRIVMYWCITWLLVFTLPIFVRTLTEQVPFSLLASQIIEDFWFPIVMSIFLLPIVVWDSFRFSNRIAGPVYRIDKALRQCVSDQPADSVDIRRDDFCEGLADSVNELIGMLESRSDLTDAPSRVSSDSVKKPESVSS